MKLQIFLFLEWKIFSEQEQQFHKIRIRMLEVQTFQSLK